MAKIHKRFKSPYWICQFFSSDGRWLKRSTQLTDKKQAEEWCRCLQAAEDEIGRGSASEARLRSIIRESMVKITGKDLVVPTVRSWFNEWLAAKDGANSPGTLAKYKGAVSDLLEFLGRKAAGRLESLTQKDIASFRNSLLSEGRGVVTTNQIVSIVETPLKLAFRQGLITCDPFAGLPKLADRSRKRKQAFTAVDVRKLLAVAEGDWKGAILCAYSTGMRLGDVANLSWASIDLDVGVISFHQRKTQSVSDEQTVIGLHEDFRAWLEERRVSAWPTIPISGAIFPTLAGRHTGGKSGLSGKFSDIMKLAGVESPTIREAKGKGRNVHALSFHSFRHGAASHLFKSKLITEVQKRVTGHARGQTLAKYTHIDLEAIKQAASLIPRI